MGEFVVDMTLVSNKTHMTIPDMIDILKNKSDGLYRVFLNNGKMYQAIKSKGEVTTLVNPQGDVFKRTKESFDNYVTLGWDVVEHLEDINAFLLISQVKE